VCSVHTSVEFEKRGIAATVIITSAFRNALEQQFKGKGMPGHPCIELPHPVYYLSREQLTQIACEHIDEVIAQLTGSD
jgi:hypothetical protein